MDNILIVQGTEKAQKEVRLVFYRKTLMREKKEVLRNLHEGHNCSIIKHYLFIDFWEEIKMIMLCAMTNGLTLTCTLSWEILPLAQDL